MLPPQKRKPAVNILSLLFFVLCCYVSPFGVSATALEDNEGVVGDSTSSITSDLDGDKAGDLSGGNSCRLYMAPTTVGGIEGNYGIFTAVDLPAGATILANDGPNIPALVDFRKLPSEIFPDTDHFGLFNNVWWGVNSDVSDQFRAEFDIRDRDLANMVDLQINFGALPNCHPYRSNIRTSQPSDGIDYDDRTYLSGNHVNNPLRGSFSYYTGKHFTVDKHVAAGTELFLDYTGDWEQHGFPRVQDYFSAAALLRKWILAIGERIHLDKISGEGYTEPSVVLPIDDLVNGAKAILKLIAISSPGSPLDEFGYEDAENDYDESAIDLGIHELEQLTSRVISVLPQTIDEWNNIYHESWEIFYDRKKGIVPPSEKIVSNFPSVKDVGDAMYNISKPAAKSIQELRETGICLDHIVAGKSQAELELDNVSRFAKQGDSNVDKMTVGRGAIAARFLAKGELIVPVPFLHLLDRSLFERDADEEMSFTELILNYCFGHSESTLVMCPVTNAVLVNHCSDRNGRFSCGNDGKGPNAEYRWASDSDWDRKTKETLAMTLDDLAGANHKQQHRMMSMEIVAKRDIQEGEEIFIDYGETWEEAWLEHVRTWSNNDGDTDQRWVSSLTVFELNHGDMLTEEESKLGKESLFYGELRSDDVAMSKDGRFMATCWYEDTFELDWGLGSRHNLNINGEEEEEEEISADIDDDRDDDSDGENDGSSISWKELSDNEIFEEYAIDVGKNESVPFTHFRDNPPGRSGHFWPCSIISEHDHGDFDGDGDEDRYVVRIFPSHYHRYVIGEETFSSLAVNLLLVNYPKSSIRFVTVPYHGDQYHQNAFRHHIEINDDLFPSQWKNKK